MENGMTQERFNEKMDALDKINPGPLAKLMALSAPSVTVDTPEFYGRLTCCIVAPDSEREREIAGLIAHIDAHTAAAVAAAARDKDGNHVDDLRAWLDESREQYERQEVAFMECSTKLKLAHDAAAPQQPAQAAMSDAQIESENDGYARGLRVGLLEGASILREVYINHVYATGVAGLELRCKKAEQVLIEKADAASQQPAAAPDQSGDIFDLIREWAHLPEGKRGDVARKIIGRLNKSYIAGVLDTRELVKAEQPAAASVQASDDLQQAIDAVDSCMDMTVVEPEDAAAWQIVRKHIGAAPAQQSDGKLPQDHGQLVVVTAIENDITVMVSMVKNGVTTLIYSKQHPHNGDTVGVVDLPVEVAVFPAQQDAQPVGLTDGQIKSIFMANGFTVKEGQTDLKPYVYSAARGILAAQKGGV